MNCYKHPEAEAVGACVNCGRLICEDCKLEINGKIICKECINSVYAGSHQTPRPNGAMINSASNNSALGLVKGLSIVLLIYSLYSLLTNVFRIVTNISDDRFSMSFAWDLSLVIIAFSIIYSIVMLVRPIINIAPSLVLFIVSLLLGIFSNVRLLAAIGGSSIKLPFSIYISWYLLPILALILTVAIAAAKNSISRERR